MFKLEEQPKMVKIRTTTYQEDKVDLVNIDELFNTENDPEGLAYSSMFDDIFEPIKDDEQFLPY